MIKSLKRTGTKDQDLSTFEKYVNEFSQPLVNSAIIDGRLVAGVALTAGQSTVVEHKLGRELVGWLLVGKTAASDVWDSQNSNQLKARTLLLNCSADVTVDLWVF